MASNEGKNPALEQLKSDLKEGRPGILYVLHGEEAYLRDHYLDRIKNAVLTPGLEEFNLHLIQGKDASPRVISEAVDCLPMMSERTMVLVTDYNLSAAPEGDREALVSLLSDLPEYVCLIFMYDLMEFKLDARTKLAQALKKHGQIVPFPHQSQEHLVDWIHRRFRALDRSIDSELAKYLIFLCGDLMNTLAGEISKIAAYSKHSRITREDIDAVAIPLLDSRVFQMTDAILKGNFDRAAQVLGELYSQQETPYMILAALGRQLRQLYTARLILEDHKNTQYLMQLWDIKHAFLADNLMKAAARTDLPRCRRAVIRAAQVDLAMKTSVGTDANHLLTEFLLELAHG